MARHTDGALDNASAVADRIETMIIVVEECSAIRVYSLSYRAFFASYHALQLITKPTSVYGVDEHTVPPIALYPYHTILSGLRGRPRIVINVEHVELLRSCGYTWNEVADALEVSRSTIWRRL